MPTEKAETPSSPAAIDYSAIANEMPSEAPAEPASEKKPAPVESSPATEAKPEEKPAEAKQEEAPGDDNPFKSGFEKLVKQQKELREQREAAKHGFELAEVVSPAQALALKTALSKGDKLGVMTALGISYTDIAQAVVGASKGEPPKPPAQPAKESPAEQAQRIALESLPPQVQEVVTAYKRQQQVAVEQQVKSAIKEVITAHASKLKHVSGLEAVEEVSAVMEEMFARAGGFPSNDPRENIRIAAEEAELRLARQAQRWAKVLTPAEESQNIPASKAPVKPDSPAQSSGGKTLTNNLGAVASKSPPLNTESLIRDIASELSKL